MVAGTGRYHGVTALNGRCPENAMLARVITRVSIALPLPETARFDIRL